MWLSERYTFSRGRSVVPAIFSRMRAWMRCRISFRLVCVIMSSLTYQRSRPATPFGFRSFTSFRMIARGSDASQTRSLRSCLAGLLLQPLVGIAHTLVLVRIRLAQRAHVGRHLAHFLPVDAENGQMRLLGIDRHLDARRQRNFNRVRVAQ